MWIGDSFAIFRMSGKWPAWKLILIISKREGAIISADIFRTLGESPSKPVALLVSSDFMVDIKVEMLMASILKCMFVGISVSG